MRGRVDRTLGDLDGEGDVAASQEPDLVGERGRGENGDEGGALESGGDAGPPGQEEGEKVDGKGGGDGDEVIGVDIAEDERGEAGEEGGAKGPGGEGVRAEADDRHHEEHGEAEERVEQEAEGGDGLGHDEAGAVVDGMGPARAGLKEPPETGGEGGEEEREAAPEDARQHLRAEAVECHQQQPAG